MVLSFHITSQTALKFVVSSCVLPLSPSFLYLYPLPSHHNPFPTHPSIHTYVFYFPFLTRPICNPESLTPYLTSVGLQIVGWYGGLKENGP